MLADNGCLNIKFKRIGFPDINISDVETQEWLRAKYNMSTSAISEEVENLLEGTVPVDKVIRVQPDFNRIIFL